MEKWKREFIRYLFHYSASRMRIEPAYVVKHPHVPSLLYKYRRFSDYHKTALEKGVLWTASPDKFNDPYDSGVYFDIDRFLIEDQSAQEFIKSINEMKDAIRKGDHWTPKPIVKPIEQGEWRRKITNDLLASAPTAGRDGIVKLIEKYFRNQSEQHVRNMSEGFRKGYGVLCLAENSTSVLMWSHYSQNHEGFCIEYNFDELDPDDLRRRLCYPVFYRKKMADATRYLRKGTFHDYNNLFGIFMCLLKSDEWEYEREWRIVETIGPRVANRELQMPKPSAIILGAHVQAADESWMRKFCTDNAIPLKKTVQRHNEFRLEIRDAA
jgi:hypothetical protein